LLLPHILCVNCQNQNLQKDRIYRIIENRANFQIPITSIIRWHKKNTIQKRLTGTT